MASDVIKYNYNYNNVGIDNKILSNVIDSKKSVHIYSSKLDKKNIFVSILLSKILNNLDDEEFKEKLFSKINFICDYGSFSVSIEENMEFSGKFVNNDVIYNINVKCDDKKIYFDSESIEKKQGRNIILEGKMLFDTEDKVIKYNACDASYSKTYNYCYYDIINKNDILVFNNKGYQLFQKNTNSSNNYCVDRDGKKSLQPFSLNQNYCNTSSKWRIDDKILYKFESKKFFDDFIDENINYSIGQNKNNIDKKLPIGGTFYGVKPELFEDYLNERCSLYDVINSINTKSVRSRFFDFK